MDGFADYYMTKKEDIELSKFFCSYLTFFAPEQAPPL